MPHSSKKMVKHKTLEILKKKGGGEKLNATSTVNTKQCKSMISSSAMLYNPSHIYLKKNLKPRLLQVYNANKI